MLTMLSVRSTLAFDPFGDIEIHRGDLKVNTDLSATMQILVDYLKTNKPNMKNIQFFKVKFANSNFSFYFLQYLYII